MLLTVSGKERSNMSLTAVMVLVRTVTTVVGAVTHPVAGNAAVVPAFKLG